MSKLIYNFISYIDFEKILNIIDYSDLLPFLPRI